MDTSVECVACEQKDLWHRALVYARAWLVLIVGLFLFSVSIVLQVKSDFGLGPWDIFHVGVARVSGLSLGEVSIIAGFVVVVLTYVLARVRPGPGTVANMVLIGVFIDWTYDLIPRMSQLPFQALMFASGMVLMGLASAVYIGAGLGAGPRDSLMLGLHHVTGWSVRLTRTVIEATVFTIGFLLGGTFGLGTILFVFGIGPLVQLFFKWFKTDAHR